MNKIILIFFIFTFATNATFSQCNDQLLSLAINQMPENFDYIKDIKIHLKKSKKNKPPLAVKQSIVLNKGMTYVIYARNASEFDGKIIFQLHNLKGNIASSYVNGRHYKTITYTCTATGIYYLTSFYEDGLEGCSVIVIAAKPKKHEINSYLENN